MVWEPYYDPLCRNIHRSMWQLLGGGGGGGGGLNKFKMAAVAMVAKVQNAYRHDRVKNWALFISCYLFSHYSSFIPLVLVLFVWGTFVTLCVTVTNIFM
jgi:hypothetical protein